VGLVLGSSNIGAAFGGLIASAILKIDQYVPAFPKCKATDELGTVLVR
jgi:hypothetical protein